MDPNYLKEMFIDEAKAALERWNQSGGSGGGVEVKTCNVRFVGNSWAGATFGGVYAYTKLVGGKLEVSHLATYETNSEFDITLEDVVCGTVISFKWLLGGNAPTVYYDDCISLVDPELNFSDAMEFIVHPDATDTTVNFSMW